YYYCQSYDSDLSSWVF
nr:immunoglobulin light chain junction region [Macaca mulatta]